MHAKDDIMNIREPRNECGFDTGSGQKAPGFFVLMPVGRLPKILPPLIRIIKYEEENNQKSPMRSCNCTPDVRRLPWSVCLRF